MDVKRAIEEIEHFFIGKRHVVELALACLISRGHLLLEDIPGVGKTTLALAVAKVFGLEFKRMQFTSDLMPSDITGSFIFDQSKSQFVFKKGPIFTNVFLADEINRAPPKTQSALLEAMAEKQVTADGNTFPLPFPFFVVATQNPVEQYGTFPLPESQKDRFSVILKIGYLGRETEKEILRGEDPLQRVKAMKPVLKKEDLEYLQRRADNCYVSDDVIDYVLDIVQRTREHPSILTGVSTRGAMQLLRVSRAMALLRGRDFVIPDDVKDVAPFVLSHRIVPREETDGEAVLKEIVEEIKIPL